MARPKSPAQQSRERAECRKFAGELRGKYGSRRLLPLELKWIAEALQSHERPTFPPELLPGLKAWNDVHSDERITSWVKLVRPGSKWRPAFVDWLRSCMNTYAKPPKPTKPETAAPKTPQRHNTLAAAIDKHASSDLVGQRRAEAVKEKLEQFEARTQVRRVEAGDTGIDHTRLAREIVERQEQRQAEKERAEHEQKREELKRRIEAEKQFFGDEKRVQELIESLKPVLGRRRGWPWD